MTTRYKLNLPALGIATYNSDWELIDYGLVYDIKKTHRETLEKFGVPEYERQIICENFDSGFPRAMTTCIPVKKLNEYYLVTAYEPSQKNWETILNCGHEQTHVLHIINKLYLLQRALKEKGIDIDLKPCNDISSCSREEMELVAYIGGLYAAMFFGKDPRNLRHSDENSLHGRACTSAIDLYKYALSDDYAIKADAPRLFITEKDGSIEVRRGYFWNGFIP